LLPSWLHSLLHFNPINQDPMTETDVKIDRDKVAPPTVEFTQMAISQLRLILENDHTLKDKYLRLLVATKGCDGFSYNVGFTEKKKDDFLVPVMNARDLEVLVDPFAAYYGQEMTVDYVQDFEENIEGFLVVNHHQKDFHGKFWRGKPELTPPLAGTTTTNKDNKK
jgi:iron-sulfur cluster insertion protein